MDRLFFVALTSATMLVVCGDNSNNPASGGEDSPSTPFGGSSRYGTMMGCA